MTARRDEASRVWRLTPVARLSRRALLRGTSLRAATLVGLVCGISHHAAAQPAPNARPQGGIIVGGAATIARTPSATTVTQTSARAALDWSGFDIGSKQTVTFTAPAPSDVTLNRVTGPDPSQVAGHIVANDQLVIVNQSGVVFSKGAEVDTAGLVVSASGISPAQFMSGSMAFDAAPHPGAQIENQGRITVKDRGLAALVAPQVANDGVITARMGDVVLAGAEAHTVDLYGDGMLSINVTRQVTQASLGGKRVTALVTNTGAVRADGGTVVLTAQAVDGLVTTLVSSGGKVSADTIGARLGTVLVDGVGGSVRVVGEIDARGLASGTAGGRIEINATQAATVAAGARIDASGRAGGGTIALGTTLARAQGGASATHAALKVTTARVASLEQGATLAADAIVSGDGGRITLLSTRATSDMGAITARGGARGGSGGQAEVSGEAGYALGGTVDLGAPHGARGALLIDPTNLTIVATVGSLDGAIVGGTLPATAPDSVPPPSTVSAAVLHMLGTDLNLVLQAQVTLTVSAPVNVGQALTLQAGKDLVVNAPIIAGGALTLSAATPTITGFDPTGALSLAAAISAGGPIALSAGTGGISAQSAIAGAALTVATGGVLTFGPTSSVSLGAGVLDVSSAGIAQDPASTIAAAVFQSAGGITGPVSLAGSANAISILGAITVTGGDFSIRNSTPLLVSGPLDGTGGGNVALSVGNAATAPTLTLGSGGSLAAAPGKTLSITADSIVAGSSGVALAAAIGKTLSISADSIGAGSSGATLSANGGTIEIAPFTPGTAVAVNGPGSAGTLGLPLAALTVQAGAGGTLRIGAALGTTTAGGIVFAGATDVTAAAGTLNLQAAGGVSQTAGATLSANTLTGTVGTLSLGSVAPVLLPRLGPLTSTGGPITLADAQDLEIGGAIAAMTDVSLTASAGHGTPGALLVGQSITGLSVTLSAADAITQTGGTIAAARATSLHAHGTLTLAGTVGGTTAGATVALASDTGDVTETLSGVTSGAVVAPAGTLSANAPLGSVLLSNAAGNRVGTLGASAAHAMFVLDDGQSLVAASAVASATGDVTLSSSGDLTLNATVTTPGTATLLATGTIGQNGLVTAGPLATLTAGGDIDQGGTVTAGAVSESAGGNLNHGGISTATSGAGAFSAGGMISQPAGTIMAATGLTLTAATGIAFGGTLSAATLTLASTGGDIGETAIGAESPTGVVLSPLLTVSAAGQALLNTPSSPGAGNQVATLATFTTGTGFTLIDGSALTLAGPGTAGGGVTLSAGGTLAQLGAIGGASIGEAASGAITVSAAAIATAGPVALTSSGGAIAQTAGTIMATGGDVTLVAGGGAITQAAGALIADPGGTVSLAASSGIAFGATLSGNRVTLAAGGGDVTETAPGAANPTGVILAASASVSATGQVLLTTPSPAGGGNQIAALSGFGAGGAFILLNGETLTVSGPGAASGAASGVSITVAGGDLAVDASVSGTAGVTLSSGLDLSIAAPVRSIAGGVTVTAPRTITLAATGAVDAQGAASLAAGLDLIELGAVAGATVVETAGGAITQASGTVASVGALTLTAGGGIAFGGTLAGDTVALSATTGNIVETAPGAASPTGAVVARVLAVSAGGTGLLDTPSAPGLGNQVASLGPVGTLGDFTLLDGISLTVSGTVTALAGVATQGTITIDASGAASDLTIDAKQTAAASLSLTAGRNISVAASLLSAGSLGSLTLTAGGGITQSAGTAIAQSGANGATSLSASGDIAFAGTIAATGVVSLVSRGGGVTETGGTGNVQSAQLTGSAAGAASLGGGNGVGQLGPFASGGDLTFADTGALTVAGLVRSSGGAVTLTSSLQIAQSSGAIDAATGIALVAGGGGITQSPGASISDPEPGGRISLASTLGIAFGGSIAGGGAVALSTVAGAITETSGAATPTGTVSAAVLTVVAPGDIVLNGPSAGGTRNQIATLGSLAGSLLTLFDGTGLIVAGPVSVTGPIDIAVRGAGNALVVDTPLTSRGPLTLAADGTLTNVAALSSTTSASLSAGGDLIQAGSVTAPALSLFATGGNITETAFGAASPTGVVSTAALTGSASGAALLDTPSGNQVAMLGAFATGGAFSLADAVPLLVAGPLASKGPATLADTGGALVIAGLVTAPQANLFATAGDITQTGAGLLAVGRLTGAANGQAALTGANRIAQLGPFTTGGGFALTDAVGNTVLDNVTSGGSLAITVAGAANDLAQASGTIQSLGGALSLASGGGIRQSAGATLRAVVPAGVSLVAANAIALGGVLDATGTTATLTAGGGGIAEGGAGVVRAGLLTGASGGQARFDTTAGNAVAQLGSFSSGNALTLLDGVALTVSGPLAAQRIDLETPATLTLVAGRISASQGLGAASEMALLQGVPAGSGAGYDIYLRAANVTQTGQTLVNPGLAAATGALAPEPILRIDLAGQAGTLNLADLMAPSTQLLLVLGDGAANGTIDVGGLHLAIPAGATGSAALFGMVAGQTGPASAGVSTLAPLQNSNYRIDSCAIASINCVLLSPVSVPITNPVQDVEVGNTNNQRDDPDVIFPNVGERDF